MCCAAYTCTLAFSFGKLKVTTLMFTHLATRWCHSYAMAHLVQFAIPTQDDSTSYIFNDLSIILLFSPSCMFQIYTTGLQCNCSWSEEQI